jgi:hypothetical protein
MQGFFHAYGLVRTSTVTGCVQRGISLPLFYETYELFKIFSKEIQQPDNVALYHFNF